MVIHIPWQGFNYGTAFSPSLHLPTEEKEELYGTRHQEAVKIFNALLSQENLADPIKQVQSVIQKCFDVQDLQSEVREPMYFDHCSVKSTNGSSAKQKYVVNVYSSGPL